MYILYKSVSMENEKKIFTKAVAAFKKSHYGNSCGCMRHGVFNWRGALLYSHEKAIEMLRKEAVQNKINKKYVERINALRQPN